MKMDCVMKRGKLISKVNSLLQELSFVSPDVMMNLLKIYATAFFVSSLWDLYFPEVVRIFSTWNVTVRNIFGLPRTTHRYFIEGVSGSSHPKTMICSRFMKFLEGISISTNVNVRHLANIVINDRRTLEGLTMARLATDCNTDRSSLTYNIVNNMQYKTPSVDNLWRLPMLKELLSIRCGEKEVAGFDAEAIDVMIDDICPK